MRNHVGENENFTQKIMNLSVACKELFDVRKKQIWVIFLVFYYFWQIIVLLTNYDKQTSFDWQIRIACKKNFYVQELARSLSVVYILRLELFALSQPDISFSSSLDIYDLV